MNLSVQLVIDCADPHALADWWAETLGWEVEPQDEQFIRSMIDQGLATEDDTRRHRGRVVWDTATAINAAEPGPGRPRILFQMVPESKAGKNRLHLDLRGHDDPERLRRELVSRGATAISEGQQGPHRWVTMTDPEGNEFCV